MPVAQRRPMAPLDSIWLSMDRPNNLMVIDSVMFLAETPDWDEVIGLFETRVVERFPVFRQHPEQAGLLGSRPHWVDDEDFDLGRHFRRATLASPGDDAALQRYMEQHVATPLDPSHPLWEVHLLDGHGSGAAIFLRTHHALADGLALGRVLLSLTEQEDEAEGPQLASALTQADLPPAKSAARSPAGSLASLGLGMARTTIDGAMALGTLDGLRGATRLAVRTTQVVSDLLLSHNPDNPLSGSPGPAKRIAWTGPIPLEGAKALGRLAGATVNDVLLSAVAGALRTYQLDRGVAPSDLLTMVPVNLRDLRVPLPPELGNDFTLIYVRFPSATAAPLARLAETKRRMDWLKGSPETVLTHLLMEFIGRVGRGLDRPVIDFFANKALGVTTNVIGPRSRLRLAGVPVEGVLGWVPGSGTHTVGVSIFTYAGTVRVGVVTDASLVPDPERLVAAFEAELDLLVSLARPQLEQSAKPQKKRPARA
jgi:diacylglycerol O-acyltransferase